MATRPDPTDITSTHHYEFTKYFVKAAQRQFLNLDGLASDICKFVIEFEGSPTCLTWHTDTDGEGIVTIVDDAFEKTFCQLFVDLGLSVYYAYELPLKNIYMANLPGSARSSFSTGGKDQNGPENEENPTQLNNAPNNTLTATMEKTLPPMDNSGAIEILGTYAGATCFDHMVECGVTEDLLKALTAEKYWWKWSSWGKIKGKENLYYLTAKDIEIKEGQIQGQAQGQGQGHGLFNKEARYISSSDFFLKPIPVLIEEPPSIPSTNKPPLLPLKSPASTRSTRMKRIRSLQFLPKNYRGTFNFELEPLNENDSATITSSFPRELDDFVKGVKPGPASPPTSNLDSNQAPPLKPLRNSTPVSTATRAEQICRALLRDESFEWNETAWRSKLSSGPSQYGLTPSTVTLATKHNIAKVLKHQRRFEEAFNVFSEVLEVQRKVLGARHRYTLKTKCTMANLLESQGRYKEALELYKKILKLQGSSHPDSQRVKSNMEGAMDEQGALKTLTELTAANFLEVDRNELVNPFISHKKTGGNKRNTIM